MSINNMFTIRYLCTEYISRSCLKNVSSSVMKMRILTALTIFSVAAWNGKWWCHWSISGTNRRTHLLLLNFSIPCLPPLAPKAQHYNLKRIWGKLIPDTCVHNPLYEIYSLKIIVLLFYLSSLHDMRNYSSKSILLYFLISLL